MGYFAYTSALNIPLHADSWMANCTINGTHFYDDTCVDAVVGTMLIVLMILTGLALTFCICCSSLWCKICCCSSTVEFESENYQRFDNQRYA